MLSASNGQTTAINATRRKREGVVERGGATVGLWFSESAHFQHESNWSSIDSPHLGQVRMVTCSFFNVSHTQRVFVEQAEKTACQDTITKSQNWKWRST
jgi:hypothetical protein